MTGAKSRGVNYFELFSNSPMWWMTTNHNPSGNSNGADDNLQSWNYQQHAVYLASIALEAKNSFGITFSSVEPFNEPYSDWWVSTGTQVCDNFWATLYYFLKFLDFCRARTQIFQVQYLSKTSRCCTNLENPIIQEGCHFEHDTQNDVAIYLRGELNSRGLSSILVSASDENTYDLATATWNSFNSTAKASIGRVNVHGYQYGDGDRVALYDAVSEAGLSVWNSEYG